MNKAAVSNDSEILNGGVIVVDKPAEMTSAAVVRRLKRLPGINKIGHAGTLDPFATGVLVCPINQGTRLSQFFLHSRKRYGATLKLGEATDTQDHTGTLLAEKPVPDLSENTINKVFLQFLGDTWQLPPAYSALKLNGVPLYKHARNGNLIQKPARLINVTSIEILNICLPEIDFQITCSAGTYIRTICTDIGERLGCGGHLKKLDRIESSGFSREEAHSLAALEKIQSANQLEGFVIPMTDALKGMPSYKANSEIEKKIIHGGPLTATDFSGSVNTSLEKRFIKITADDNRLLAVIYADYKYCCVFN